MLELDQLSRQVHGRLDTKLVRLDTLIRDADQRIEKLSRLEGASGGGAVLELTLDEEVPPDPGAAATHVDDGQHGSIYELADDGLSPVDIARRVGRPTGEVELILSLRDAHAGSAAPPDPLSPLPATSNR